MDKTDAGINKKYQLVLEVIALSKKAPTTIKRIDKTILFLTGLFKPRKDIKNQSIRVRRAILASGSKYINTTKGNVNRKDITKRNHSLYKSFFERIIAVNSMTVTFAISDGCI